MAIRDKVLFGTAVGVGLHDALKGMYLTPGIAHGHDSCYEERFITYF